MRSIFEYTLSYRNRIARCDASIARLASDLKSLVDEQRHVSQQHVDADSRLGDKLQALEARIVDLHQRQERVAGEAVMRVKGVEGEASKALSLLDSRTRAVVDDLKNAITNVQILADSEREKLETRLIAHIEKENTSIHSRIVSSFPNSSSNSFQIVQYPIRTKLLWGCRTNPSRIVVLLHQPRAFSVINL